MQNDNHPAKSYPTSQFSTIHKVFRAEQKSGLLAVIALYLFSFSLIVDRVNRFNIYTQCMDRSGYFIVIKSLILQIGHRNHHNDVAFIAAVENHNVWVR